ncbi:PREDICTED: stem-specific protein TSJT1 [Tarenaya hassleriana]|uniref:stem-specific protein TSJT1 n=1 Tax=Tarenaya hassleriana TaxID=28532 RepID=UPI00053C7AA7|nr:PREDICTED: stem-specific protein TSJT1 [Tarenaya hassleriana]
MLAIFQKAFAHPPEELNSPASKFSGKAAKLPGETLSDFLSRHPETAFSMSFGQAASLAYVRPDRTRFSLHQRLFCGVEGIYCLFLGRLNNLCSLNRQYGLSGKVSNDAMLVIEAYRTLRDRGPYPADQVLRDLDGSFAFIIYDTQTSTVFAALSSDGGVNLYWGLASDGSVVISDNLDIIKQGCSKSYAPFPTGCMFHSEIGLKSFEHPTNKMKAMQRIDSEGVICGANFKVDVYSKTNSIPRRGSEANWALANSR